MEFLRTVVRNMPFVVKKKDNCMQCCDNWSILEKKH